MSIVLIKGDFKLVMPFVLAMILFAQCKQEYAPEIQTQTTGLLVVEGFLNNGQGPTIIRLSRSSDLQDTTLKPEPGAQLAVEGEDGSSFLLFDNGNGIYIASQLIFNSNVNYRLHIVTPNGKEYASDYSSVRDRKSVV